MQTDRDFGHHMVRSLLAGIAVVTVGCASAPIKSGKILDGYARAECVQARRTNADWLREWDRVVQGPDNCTARIVGAVRSTGFVAVEYPPDTVRHVVSDFGEKSNPIAVRVDLASCRLYVWSSGSPIFAQPPYLTHLVEYDLRNRRELQSATLDAQVVLSKCPDLPKAG
jgi:hypothetical protein